LDGIAELKRELKRVGINFPIITKDNAKKMVDPELFYQLFFVGQDGKDSSTIFNNGYYKKEDFWNCIYAFFGIGCETDEIINEEDIKNKIDLLSEERKAILLKHKILRNKKATELDLVSQQRYKEAFEKKIKSITGIHKKITDLSKERNRAISRRLKNEKTLSEINSLNRTDISGSLFCGECGSDHISYKSGDKSYTFELTDIEMRNNIKQSIQEKIEAYKETEETCNFQIGKLQVQLQEILKDKELTLETVLMYKDEILEASSSDSRLIEIDKELKSLKESLVVKTDKSKDEAKKRGELKKQIVQKMNEFYKNGDANGSIVFDDLFSKRTSIYSGCEETEFYLAKLYSLASVLKHNYPIMMDFFRDGELSSEKEESVLFLFSSLKNQKIFTATLKTEELGKYKKRKNINSIDYSENKESHILSKKYTKEFKEILESMMITIK
jgi:hypothetical protein